jgi:hypothetical protein
VACLSSLDGISAAEASSLLQQRAEPTFGEIFQLFSPVEIDRDIFDE